MKTKADLNNLSSTIKGKSAVALKQYDDLNNITKTYTTTVTDGLISSSATNVARWASIEAGGRWLTWYGNIL